MLLLALELGLEMLRVVLTRGHVAVFLENVLVLVVEGLVILLVGVGLFVL